VLQDAKRAVALAPLDADLRFALGEALFREGDFDGAVKQLSKALEPSVTSGTRTYAPSSPSCTSGSGGRTTRCSTWRLGSP
jgi:hypothetical protein